MSACRHGGSLWARCVSCGSTWAQQAYEQLPDGVGPAWWATPNFGAYHARQISRRLIADARLAQVLDDFSEELHWLGETDTLTRLRAALGVGDAAFPLPHNGFGGAA